MDCSTPGFPLFHYLPQLAQIHSFRDMHRGYLFNTHSFFFFLHFLEKSDCLLIANEEENICLTLALLILNFPSFVLDNHLCANVTIIKVSKEVNIQLLCKKSQRASCLVLSSYLFAIVRDKPQKF